MVIGEQIPPPVRLTQQDHVEENCIRERATTIEAHRFTALFKSRCGSKLIRGRPRKPRNVSPGPEALARRQLGSPFVGNAELLVPRGQPGRNARRHTPASFCTSSTSLTKSPACSGWTRRGLRIPAGWSSVISGTTTYTRVSSGRAMFPAVESGRLRRGPQKF